VSSLSSADSGDRLRFKPGILKNVSSRARNVNGNFQQRVVLSSTSYSDASKSSISCISSLSSIVVVGSEVKFNDQSRTQPGFQVPSPFWDEITFFEISSLNATTSPITWDKSTNSIHHVEQLKKASSSKSFSQQSPEIAA